MAESIGKEVESTARHPVRSTQGHEEQSYRATLLNPNLRFSPTPVARQREPAEASPSSATDGLAGCGFGWIAGVDRSISISINPSPNISQVEIDPVAFQASHHASIDPAETQA